MSIQCGSATVARARAQVGVNTTPLPAASRRPRSRKRAARSRDSMALLAEELVEEWLNRMGYFTIRGLKLGVHEIDLLAVRPGESGLECRHLEVQASVRPVSYVTRVPKEIQKATGRAAGSAKTRTDDELRQGIKEWVHKKFDYP